jgi:hypothetical protein
MKHGKRIVVSFSILIVLIGVFFVVTNNVSKYNGLSVSNGETKFQKCLSTQDIKLFINTESTDESIKNTGLFDNIQYFKIQNCFTNNQICLDNGVSDFPTWIINGNKYSGDITESQLSEYTSCSLK